MSEGSFKRWQEAVKAHQEHFGPHHTLRHFHMQAYKTLLTDLFYEGVITSPVFIKKLSQFGRKP